MLNLVDHTVDSDKPPEHSHISDSSYPSHSSNISLFSLEPPSSPEVNILKLSSVSIEPKPPELVIPSPANIWSVSPIVSERSDPSKPKNFQDIDFTHALFHFVGNILFQLNFLIWSWSPLWFRSLIDPYLETAWSALLSLPSEYVKHFPIIFLAFLFSPKLFLWISIFGFVFLSGYLF
ncbi:hypothetical protein HK096_008845, partial [Nowakowskiella sp. JEL0078]